MSACRLWTRTSKRRCSVSKIRPALRTENQVKHHSAPTMSSDVCGCSESPSKTHTSRCVGWSMRAAAPAWQRMTCASPDQLSIGNHNQCAHNEKVACMHRLSNVANLRAIFCLSHCQSVPRPSSTLRQVVWLLTLATVMSCGKQANEARHPHAHRTH